MACLAAILVLFLALLVAAAVIVFASSRAAANGDSNLAVLHSDPAGEHDSSNDLRAPGGRIGIEQEKAVGSE